MPLPLLERFRSLLVGDAAESDRADASDADDDAFVPSPLDRSVRSSHGSGERAAAREVQAIQEEAARREGVGGHDR
ncbi:MAG: hypothetical protein ACOCZD_02695 [Haloferacaceae archaeon]